MPDLEISNLPALAEAGVAATDPIAIADLSASETKKVTVKDLIEAGVALIDTASIPAAKVGTLGTDQVATGAIVDANVTNVKLQHSSISIGGVSISLGGTDATPAFNLADATGYPTSSLSGTITNAQLAGSVDNNKLANSSVSLGGISISLGGTDATPAFNLTDATGYPTSSLVGTITNAQLAGSIDVSKLVGSNVNFGGVTVALGGSDTTPAFNLADATGYPTSSLVGTITNAQLAGSIANDKLSNSSVTLGGVSISLGASDATPAFNLADATGYPTSSLTGTITNAQLAGSIAVSKLVASSASIGGVTITLGTTDATPAFNLTSATNYATSALVGTITNAQLAGSIEAAKIVSGSITSTQLGTNSVTATELANDAVDTGAVQNAAITNDKVQTSTNSTTGLDGATKLRDGTVTAAKLNTSNIDRSLNVASGNLGINNAVTGGAATRSGITYNAQGLITGSAALVASDLPISTASAVGGVSVGTGLSVSGAGALSLTNSVTGATVSGITFNNQGMITAATGLTAANLPVATTSAKGAVQITSGGGLTVDGSGNLITSTSGITAGTYQSITVNDKGVATAGAALTASLIPDLAASKITSGSIDAARIGTDSIDGSKLSNSSTAVFQSIAQSGYPTAQFNGQILFDTVSEDAFIWDGNAWQAITTLTKGSLVFGGTFNAATSQMVATTSAGIAAGLAVGSNLPTPSSTTDGVYVVVSNSGTPSAPAPVVALAPPDYVLGVTNSAGSSWNEVDLSQTVAGQVASNITFTPYGQLSATNVQDALQEIETEKMGFGGGTLTGQLLVGNTGSLVFEGSSIDAFETTIGVANPTASDKTILFPDVSGNVITSGDTNTVNKDMVDGSLINTNLAANASIAFSKLAALTSTQIIVGNGSNVPTAVAITGDIGINNAGLTSITAGAIVNADINASAAIAGSKVTTGTTSAVGVLQLTNSAASTSATTAATPAAVKTAKDAADAAASTANAALPKAGGTMTGNLVIDNAKEIRLSEADGAGANFTGLKAQAQSADITLTLPAVAPTTGQVLKSSSTATTLEWATDSATDSTKLPLAGGTLTGNLTLNAQSDVRFADADSSHYVALQSPGTIASSFTLTLPSTDAAVDGYVLASNGSGVLSWVDPGSSASPTFTGDATLTNDGALVGASSLNATYTGNTKTLTVTVASKTAAHRYYGSGSSSGYKIGGKESPFLTLTPGRTYKFDQADNSNSGHPLRFYLEANKTTAYTTGVTTNGTAGSAGAYTQIVVSDTTPQILHYQCSSHASMGNSVQTNSNVSAKLATARTINAVSFDGSANILVPKLVPSSGQAGTAIEIIDTGSDAHLKISLDGSEKYRFLNDGLAIGATSVSSGIPAGANNLVMKGSGDVGLSIIAGDDDKCRIVFTDEDRNLAGSIDYDNDGDYLSFAADASERFRINSSGVTVTGTATATAFSGPLTGNVTGNASGSAATVTGAAQSAITSLGTLASLGITGNLTVDTNTLHVDATNNRVGIGTTSPIETIQATGAIVSSGSNNTSSTAGANRSIIDFTSGGTRIGHFRGTTSAGSGSVKFFVDSSEKMQIDSSGRLLVGHTANIVNGTVQSVSDGSALDCLRFAASEYGTHLTLIKSRSASVGTATVVHNNDDIGTIHFKGADGSNYIQAASIQGEVDGTPGANDMPGRLVFSTTADGANSATERMRIDSSGRAWLGNDSGYGPNPNADDLIVGNRTSGIHHGITILSHTASLGALHFGDTSHDSAGVIKYDHNVGSMQFATETSTALTLDSSQNATFAGNVAVSGTGSYTFSSAEINSAVGLFINNTDTANNRQATLSFSTDSGNRPKSAIAHIDTGLYGKGKLVFALDPDEDDGVVNIAAHEVLTLSPDKSAVFAGTVSDSKGNLRSIPANVKSSSYTLIASDAGKHISTTAAVTIPPSVLSIGDAVTIYNDSSSAIALTRGSGVTMYNSADATNANRSLAGRGLATLMMVGTNHFVISGAGLS